MRPASSVSVLRSTKSIVSHRTLMRTQSLIGAALAYGAGTTVYKSCVSHPVSTSANPIPSPRPKPRRAATASPSAELNDSNPTRHGWPRCRCRKYAADPRGDRTARGAGRVPARKVIGRLREMDSRHTDNAGVRSDVADAATPRTGMMSPVPASAPSTDHLYLLSSTSQAYSWLIKLLCDAGDAVLAPKPGYPLIESIAPGMRGHDRIPAAIRRFLVHRHGGTRSPA